MTWSGASVPIPTALRICVSATETVRCGRVAGPLAYGSGLPGSAPAAWRPHPLRVTQLPFPRPICPTACSSETDREPLYPDCSCSAAWPRGYPPHLKVRPCARARFPATAASTCRALDPAPWLAIYAPRRSDPPSALRPPPAPAARDISACPFAVLFPVIFQQ